MVLIKSGANIGHQNTSGQTPLMLASSKSPRRWQRTVRAELKERVYSRSYEESRSHSRVLELERLLLF